jgi:long-subunit fatty acid transport protein
MTRVLTTASILALGATSALAGGIDRSGQSVGIIFEQGNYIEFSLGTVSPNVSGTAIAGLGGASSGDMAASYAQLGLGYKQTLANGLEAAIIYDQPFGANVDYPTGTGYYAQGSTAELKAHAITGILKYKMPSNVSVYGGLRYQTLEATASIPFVGGYTATGERDGGVGYLVGAAWEKPEIALRVALTYNSKIKHEVTTTETGPGALVSTTDIETPQSVNLDFQSGIAANTLLFGSIRWVEWSAFDITPAVYFGATGGGSLVSYDNDTISYSLGVGRKINENWSAAVTLGYEKANGGFSSNLGPTDGNKSIGVGATYTKDNMKVTGGIRYVDIGDAQTQLGAFAPSANFNNNHALGVGMRVGFSF